MGRYSDLYLKEQQNKLGQQQEVKQQPVVAPTQPKPIQSVQTAQRPQSVAEGIGNIGRAIYNGGANLVQTIAENPVQYAKDMVNGLVVEPAKEVVTHPAASAQSFLGGAARGTVMLPQNIQNLVADTQDAYMGRENYSKKWNYAPNLTKNLQGNPLYEHYKEQQELAPTLNEFGDFVGAGLGLGGAAGATTKIASNVAKAGKIAKETARISNKLSDLQKAKYATQIEKLAAKKVADNIAKESVAKAVAAKTFGNQLKQNTTMGAALGALEGDNFEDRVSNAAQMAAIGGLLTGAHAGVGKLAETRPGRIAKIETKKLIRNASDIPAVSRAISNVDYMFNTDVSKLANDITRKRRDFRKEDAKNDDLSRHLTDEQHELLERAGDLTPDEQVQIFEYLKNNARKSEERKTTPKTDEKIQVDINSQVEDKNATAKNVQDGEKTFEQIMEEAPSTIIKRPVKKDAPSVQERLTELVNESKARAPKFNGQLPQKYYKGKLKDVNAEKGRVTQYLEPGKAEGADYSQEAWYQKDRLQNEEVDGYNTEKADMYNNNIWEDKNYEGRDSELGTTKYKSENPEMIKFMDAYDKADPKTQKKLLNDKLKSLGSQEEQIKFFEDFKAEQERKTDMNRPHKAGDIDVPSNEAEHIKDVNEAFEKNKHSKSTDFDRDIRIIENQKRRARQKQIEEANKLFDAEGNEMDFDPFPTSGKKNDYLFDNVFNSSKTRIKRSNDKWKKFKHEHQEEINKDKDTKNFIAFLDNLRSKATNINDISRELKVNKNDYNIFSSVDKRILKESGLSIIETNHSEFFNNSKGFSNFSTKTIAVDTNFSKQELAAIKRHEMQHIIDDSRIYQLPADHPIIKYLEKWEAEYETLKNDIANYKGELYKFSRQLREEHPELFNMLADATENLAINFETLDKYKQETNNVLHNDNYKRLVINKLLEGYALYSSSPKEKRAINSQFNRKNNGDIINELSEFFEKRYGEDYRKDCAEYGIHTKRGHNAETGSRGNGQGKTTDYLQRGLDKEVDASNSVAKTTLVNLNKSISSIEDAFTNLSKSREDWFRKYGTYTDERMKNRLFLQSKDGAGIYFQQASKADKKIDLNKDKKSEKVGFSGKKVYEGLRQKGTIQGALNRMYQTQVKMVHVDGQIEFLKKNFSEKKDGFVPVSSKLLANAMFFGKSKAWYETIAKGKEAISRTFSEENAKEWRELFDTTDASKSDLYLPKDIYDLCLTGEKELPADYLATYGKEIGTRNWFKAKAKQASALLDFYNDRFKRKVLTSATFFMNNRFGNQIMLMANAKNPMDYLKGIYDAIKVKDSDIPNEVLESTLAESIKQDSMNMTKKYWSEKDNGVDTLARLLNGDTFRTDNLNGLKKLAAIGVNIGVSVPNEIFRWISDFSGNVNNRMERFERKQAFSQTVSKMQKKNIIKFANKVNGTIEAAKLAKENPVLRQAVLDGVADILGDYNNFSKFERNVAKRVIPFYAWDRTIIRHAIALGKDNPVKLALIGLETYRLLNQDDGLEDYQHGSMKTKIENKRTGSKLVINKGRYIPYNTLFELLDSDERVGSVSPAITKVGEAMRGEKNFLKSEITSKNYKRITKDGKKGYLNIKTGDFKEGGAPLSVRAGYLGKEAYEFIYPHTRSALTSGYTDMAKHYKETGEILFPDKPYDANLGGLYHGDYAGKAGKYTKTQSAKNRLDLLYQIMNKYGGVGFQPEHLKEQTKEYKRKYKRK